MDVFYNENDGFAGAWLERLARRGHVPDGLVDTRSILEVDPADLRPFRQCHFFAGIGGWPYALQLAGWPDDREVWTGSCPCQPLSSAGLGRGHADERHLWPAFYRLIAECRPATVFGEQVASKDGREWLAGVRADLEALGYAVGAADLCAAGVGAPHIRQRLFWVADATGRERRQEPLRQFERGDIQDNGGGSTACGLGDADAERHSRLDPLLRAEAAGRNAPDIPETSWSSAAWLPCLDGKARRIEPAIQPLAYRFPGPRVGILRGAGNAIVPQVAAEFVRAFLETE